MRVVLGANESCNSGAVNFDSTQAEVGSGSFPIQRLTSVMNTYCTGGMSDDMDVYAAHGEQRVEFTPVREGMNASGHARYEDTPGSTEFEIVVEGLPDGNYHLYTGMEERGEFSVEIEDIPMGSYALLVGGSEVGTIVTSNMHGKVYGRIEFRDPEMYGMNYLDFDPRGQTIAVMQQNDTILEADFPLE